ncbi:MAG: hypothetical protein IJV01_07870 [Bacteroidales bacterium]|nr:hypothetical protein [Bacteroidales bacterium]
MKEKYLLLAATLLLAGACAKTETAAPVTETLYAQAEGTVRVHLTDGINAAWNAGDKVSVFYNGGENECWEYTGKDGAASGPITHNGSSDRTGKGVFTALWPYDADAVMTGGELTTRIPATQPYVPDSYGWALLCSSTDGKTLNFKYACAFLRIRLDGLATVQRISLAGGAGETLSGAVTLIPAAVRPATTFTGEGGKTLTLEKDGGAMAQLSGKACDFFMALPAGSYPEGLVVTVTLGDGSTRSFTLSGPLTLEAGTVAYMSGFLMQTDDIGVVFNKKDAVTPSLPTTSPTEDRTYSFTSGGASYQITLHAGTTGSSNGYLFYNNSCLLLGRTGAWIKLPVRAGYALFEVDYEAGSTSGRPYITDKTDGSGGLLSNQCYFTTAGQVCSMRLNEREAGKQYYFWVHTGNVLIRSLTMRYLKTE